MVTLRAAPPGSGRGMEPQRPACGTAPAFLGRGRRVSQRGSDAPAGAGEGQGPPPLPPPEEYKLPRQAGSKSSRIGNKAAAGSQQLSHHSLHCTPGPLPAGDRVERTVSEGPWQAGNCAKCQQTLRVALRVARAVRSGLGKVTPRPQALSRSKQSAPRPPSDWDQPRATAQRQNQVPLEFKEKGGRPGPPGVRKDTQNLRSQAARGGTSHTKGTWAFAQQARPPPAPAPRKEEPVPAPAGPSTGLTTV